MKKLCLLAISYNEENHIKFWIDNHKKFVDEIILVDNGSTDNTVKIARENGVKVFTYLWEHHFARAKNYALWCCSVECHPDWIFFLSPDFWVSNQDMEEVRKAIENDNFDAYGMWVMYHYDNWFSLDNTKCLKTPERIILFKENPYIFYTGRVHETVDSSLAVRGGKIGYLKGILHHDSTNVKEYRNIYYTSLVEAEDADHALFTKLSSRRATLELTRKIVDKAELWNTERSIEIPFVLDNMPDPPAKLLDVSCSESTFLLEMDKLGFDAYGIDINDYDVSYSKFVKADARKIPFGDKSFDIVTCISALEHYGLVETPYHSDTVYDPKAPFKALREMARVLKDDGIIILTLPFGYTENKDWLKWVRFYNWDMIKKLISVANLNIFKKQIKAYKNSLLHEISENDKAYENNPWCEISEKEGEKILTPNNKVNCSICLVLKK